MKRRMGFALAVAAGILATSALSRYLQATDVISAEAGRRLIQVVVGLALGVWGNYMPKSLITPVSTAVCATGRARSAIRVGGWSMTLAGLSYAGLWAFAPLPLAKVGSTAALIVAMVIMFTYGAWTLLYCRPRRLPGA